jgi:hypothetical protein
MGRHAGFIAANATLAAGEVDLCLVPELPLVLEGKKGCLEHLCVPPTRPRLSFIVGLARARSAPTALVHCGSRSCSFCAHASRSLWVSLVLVLRIRLSFIVGLARARSAPTPLVHCGSRSCSFCAHASRSLWISLVFVLGPPILGILSLASRSLWACSVCSMCPPWASRACSRCPLWTSSVCFMCPLWAPRACFNFPM